jgi:hypothetical protein
MKFRVLTPFKIHGFVDHRNHETARLNNALGLRYILRCDHCHKNRPPNGPSRIPGAYLPSPMFAKVIYGAKGLRAVAMTETASRPYCCPSPYLLLGSSKSAGFQFIPILLLILLVPSQSDQLQAARCKNLNKLCWTSNSRRARITRITLHFHIVEPVFFQLCPGETDRIPHPLALRPEKDLVVRERRTACKSSPVRRGHRAENPDCSRSRGTALRPVSGYGSTLSVAALGQWWGWSRER